VDRWDSITHMDWIVSIEEEFQIPQWQKDEVLNRLEKYKENPTQTLDFDSMMDEIEKELANEG